MSKKNPLASVSVMSTSGNGTVTDSLGRYVLPVYETDSIWFSYLGRPTPKYAVSAIPNTYSFDLSLHVQVTELKQVMVKTRNYRLDSIQNRKDYAKAFNFEKPGISSSITPGGATGLDLNEFIGMFQFRRNRRMRAFQDRLLREEEERFIDHRFSRPLIVKLTGLQAPELDTFIVRYRPDTDFIRMATDYELRVYIKKAFEKYKHFKRLVEGLRRERDY